MIKFIIMVNNEGETPAPSSGATAQAATSSNRPIVMPEAFLAPGTKNGTRGFPISKIAP